MGNQSANTPSTSKRLLKRLIIGGVIAVSFLYVIAWQRWNVVDAIKLYHYQAPSQVVNLSTETTMTTYARHVFYVNHPQVQNKSDFNLSCKSYGEQTIVLGCYHPNQNGIFVYAVNDSRLNGVQQVTAAHEMLHAAYDRLSTSERSHVDAMLLDYYAHDLHDQRILDTIASYKKTEPRDVVNEMHSVFGTEATNLPAPLENYYKRYFTNRAVVVALANSYQAEFTSRQQAVASDDLQLKTIKAQVDANNRSLTVQHAALETQLAEMNAERSSGNIAAYNANVAVYNTGITSYNQLVDQTSQLIASYNQLLVARNKLALEVNQLDQAISSQANTLQTQ